MSIAIQKRNESDSRVWQISIKNSQAFTSKFSTRGETYPGLSSSRSSHKALIVFTCFSRVEISPRGEFIPGWKTGMRFHPGLKMQKIIMWIEMNFIPGWIVCFLFIRLFWFFLIYLKCYYHFIKEKMASKRKIKQL